ncbi:hypothetical protein Hanom_Chr17g01570451 [Helianthus anomalus]
MEVETVVTSSKEGKKTVSFTGMELSSSLGPNCFLEGAGNQVSSICPSWFDEMDVDPATAEEKFIPNWNVKNKDSVMDALTSKVFLFGINTPGDHHRSRRMKSQELGAVV